VLKNGVGRYNIFFFFLHKACWILLFVSFSYRIRQCFYSSTIRLVPCAHFFQQTISHMRKRFPMSSLSGRMNIALVNIECFTGCKIIKQRRISFVLGYLRMIWKITTAIIIKHRILATFNIKIKSILTACMNLKPIVTNITLQIQDLLIVSSKQDVEIIKHCPHSQT
jgi:hypothetical protein